MYLPDLKITETVHRPAEAGVGPNYRYQLLKLRMLYITSIPIKVEYPVSDPCHETNQAVMAVTQGQRYKGAIEWLRGVLSRCLPAAKCTW